MTKNIIVAIADNYAIGKDNSLLWHISEDLKFFKRTTMGCTVIMGRKTFESIGRALPGRLNIVVTRGSTCSFPEGVRTANSVDEAFRVAESAGKDCFVIGGGEIYRQTLSMVDNLYVTEVHTVIEDADTFFPEIDPEIWSKTKLSEMQKDEKSGYGFEFVTYTRKNP